MPQMIFMKPIHYSNPQLGLKWAEDNAAVSFQKFQAVRSHCLFARLQFPVIPGHLNSRKTEYFKYDTEMVLLVR